MKRDRIVPKLEVFVKIPLNPYQGLKHADERYRRVAYCVKIPLNPYQGLKHDERLAMAASAMVKIPLNPYQGLKHAIDKGALQENQEELKFHLIPIRD